MYFTCDILNQIYPYMSTLITTIGCKELFMQGVMFLKGKSKCTYINQHVLLQIRIFDTEKES